LVAVSSQVEAAQLAIAHRGASAYAPEHTFFAYDMALAMDADMIECDMHLTLDEVPVCIHDDSVDRTTGGAAHGDVADFTLAELRALDFGSWFNSAYPAQANPDYVGARIVPFEEQLDCYLRINPHMRFHVETKDSAGGRAEQVLVDLLTRKGLIATGDQSGKAVQSSTILMQSFDAASLERIKSLAPTLPTAFLFTAPDATTLPWLLTGDGPDYVDAFAPNSLIVALDPTSVQRFHANDHDVHVWTVNDRAQMNLMLALGVDGIFTNNTDILREAIDAQGSGTTPEERGNPAQFEPGCAGIAGRVTSKDGPGDVWRPTGVRGVELVPIEPGPQPEPGSPKTSGGAMPLSALWLLCLSAIAARLHQRQRSSRRRGPG
jgi:glycerophosphoryl diester phosphodiesterase